MPAVTQKEVPLKHVQRIRDFLSLARNNSNQHEADRARERAAELMQKYGLSEKDLVEAATEMLYLNEGLDGNQRVELSRVVARSRGVTPTVDQDGKCYSFKGYPEAARDARELFAALVRIVETSGAEANQDASGNLLWRTCFWLGFTEAVQKQLDPEHGSIPKAALGQILKNTSAPAVLERAAAAFQNLSMQNGYAEAERFKSYAHDNGYKLGMAIQVPGYRGKK